MGVAMNNWLKGLADGALVGLVWLAVWIPLGTLIETTNPSAAADRLWVPLAQPGLLCGALFAAASGFANGPGRLDQLPLLRSVAWGAMIGLLVGSLPFAIGGPTTDLSIWLLGIEIIGPVAALSAILGLVSVLAARVAVTSGLRRRSPDDGKR
jgi:hypothetical protein